MTTRNHCVLLIFMVLLKSFMCKIVKTKYGSISGMQLTDYNNRTYYAFQSIPYAKIPLGELRFRLPEAIDGWQGVRNGSKVSPKCVQPDNGLFSGQEDCLYLNVYTKWFNKNSLKPVLAYLHGGGFFRLSASLTEFNPHYIITEDILIVTINYRLGAFGFMTLNDTNLITPNNGFHDQILALRWIQENIRSFGGDPRRVTLSGESAGALSAHYHLFSPLSKGLFRNLICRSSTAMEAIPPVPNDTAFLLARTLNIPTENITEMVENLRNTSAELLYTTQRRLRWFDFYLNRPMYSGLSFPTNLSDPNTFINGSLVALAKAGAFNRVPMLLSVTDMEGLIFNSSIIPNLSEMTNVTVHIPEAFGANISRVVQEVMAYYFTGRFDTPWVAFWSDIWFRHPAYKTLAFQSAYHPIYMSDFGLDTNLNVFKLNHTSIATFKGAAHTDDDSYIFVRPPSPQIEAKSLEELWMRRMVRMQANFVKFNNPTPKSEELLTNIDWKPYNYEVDNVLILRNENFTMGVYRNDRFRFWDAMFEKYAPRYY